MQENAAMNAALDKHEGCNIHGWLEVQRVAGNFHLSVHADHYFAMRSVGVLFFSFSADSYSRNTGGGYAAGMTCPHFESAFHFNTSSSAETHPNAQLT